jgi:TRAP-type mannitol/chloroaromatic compound transport system permease small subunit
MSRVNGLVAAVSLWMARIGGALLIAASVVISFEILARKFLALPFNVGTELSTYALAVSTSWSFAFTLLHRSHIRIDVVRNRLPPLGKAALDALALVSLALTSALLAWYLFDTVEASWTLGARENTPLGTPLIIPHGLWYVGLVWFALVCFVQLVPVARAAVRGDVEGISRNAGPSGVDEEIEEVLATVESRSPSAV